MLRFSKAYFLIACGLLIVEVLIARFAHDALVRPYGGDFLATLLVYCLLRSVLAARPSRIASAALLISYLIEGLQYINVLARLGWQHSRLLRIVLGSHFAWGDLLAYSLGALAILALERVLGPAPAQLRPPVGQWAAAGATPPEATISENISS